MPVLNTDYNDAFQLLIAANTDIQGYKRAIESAVARLETTVDDLTNINTKYASIFTMIDTALASDPTNEQWLALKHQADGIKNARNAVRTKLTAINTAIANA